MVVRQEDRLEPETLLQAPAAGRRKRSLRERLSQLWVRTLRVLIPSAPIAGACPACHARMELAREMRLVPEDWEKDNMGEGPTIVRGIRFWTCPQCGRTDCQRYAYVRDIYPYREC